jgi:hypothetical protein
MIRPYVPILSVCRDSPEIAIDIGKRPCAPDQYELCFRKVGCAEPPTIIRATVIDHGCGCPASPMPPPTPTYYPPECLVRYQPLYVNDDNELVFRVDDQLFALPSGRYRAVIYYLGEPCPIIIGDAQVDLCHNRPKTLYARAIPTISCC